MEKAECPERKVFTGMDSISTATTATTCESTRISSPWNTNSRDKPEWWDVINYEIEMYLKTHERLKESRVTEDRILRNAVVESLVVHARNLCTIFTSESSFKDVDILLDKITDLKPDSHREQLIEDLKTAYGKVTARGKRFTPKIQFDKGALHVDTSRGKSYDYSGEIAAIHDLIVKIIETLKEP
jgi:hypothetical protein